MPLSEFADDTVSLLLGISVAIAMCLSEFALLLPAPSVATRMSLPVSPLLEVSFATGMYLSDFAGETLSLLLGRSVATEMFLSDAARLKI